MDAVAIRVVRGSTHTFVGERGDCRALVLELHAADLAAAHLGEQVMDGLSGFLRLKLGKELEQRKVSASVFETRQEAERNLTIV